MEHSITKADKLALEKLLHECWSMVETQGEEYNEKLFKLTETYTYFFGDDLGIDIFDAKARDISIREYDRMNFRKIQNKLDSIK